MKWVSLSAALLLVAALSAQTGSFSNFGTACGSTGLTGSVPRIGMPFTVTYSGPNSYINPHGQYFHQNRPIIVVGASDRQFSGGPLPFAIPTSFTNNLQCSLYVSMDYVQLMPFAMPFPPSRFENVFTLNVPVHRSLIGVTFFVQWLMRHAQNLSLPYTEWIYTSDAGRAVIGM